MSVSYTITLTEAEDKALSVVAPSQDAWIQHTVHERCRTAMDDILHAEVKRKLAAGESFSGSSDEIILSASVESAVSRQDRFLRERKP